MVAHATLYLFQPFRDDFVKTFATLTDPAFLRLALTNQSSDLRN